MSAPKIGLASAAISVVVFVIVVVECTLEGDGFVEAVMNALVAAVLWPAYLLAAAIFIPLAYLEDVRKRFRSSRTGGQRT